MMRKERKSVMTRALILGPVALSLAATTVAVGVMHSYVRAGYDCYPRCKVVSVTCLFEPESNTSIETLDDPPVAVQSLWVAAGGVWGNKGDWATGNYIVQFADGNTCPCTPYPAVVDQAQEGDVVPSGAWSPPRWYYQQCNPE